MMSLKQLSLLIAFLVIYLISLSSAQASSGLTLALAQDHVDVTTNFSGREVVAFGVNETGGALAIILTGPKTYTLIRRKGPVLGVWANVKTYGFVDVPLYYDYAVDIDETELSQRDILEKETIGIDYMLYGARSRDDETLTRPFHEALIRHKQQRGFFAYDSQKIEYIGDKLFRVSFKLPADVPTGEYTVKALSFKDKEIIAEKLAYLQVRQAGFSARLYRYAHEFSFLYGLSVVFLAVIFGFGAHAILGRR